MKRLIRNQSGAALVVEAVVIYPLVILCLFFLLYMGLIIIQSSVLNSIAQKMALVAAREVAYPGYLTLAGDDAFATAGVEMKTNSTIKLDFETNNVKVEAYRYWSKDPLSSAAKDKITSLISDPKNGLVKSQSLLDLGKVEAKVTCSNYAVTQFVTVTIEQEILNNDVFRFFGIENPTISARAVASVNDSDEFVRDVDLVIDAVDWLAKKLGINIAELRSKVESAIDKIGLNK